MPATAEATNATYATTHDDRDMLAATNPPEPSRGKRAIEARRDARFIEVLIAMRSPAARRVCCACHAIRSAA